MTEAVFAFLYKVGFEPTAYSLTGNCTTELCYINLLRCAASVAAYSFGIHDTTHHVPFASRATQSYFTIGVYASRQQPLTINTAYEPLGATLRTNILPFLIPTD